MSALNVKMQRRIVNAMSIDVEDYFHVSAFEKHIQRDSWDGQECRVEQNIETLLSIFQQADVKATFFTLGWVAERYPGTVRRIVDSGHEVASHSYWHKRATDQEPTEFLDEISNTKKLLEDISGTEVIGYRAPSYSIGENNLWAHELIDKAGYRYSSSIYPIRHDHYGMHSAPRFPYYPVDGSPFLEIPITTSYFLGRRMPAGGGGYFRFFPYFFSRMLIDRVNNKEGSPGVFYMHPWEIDPGQPRQNGISLKTRFRHYINLHRTQFRLVKLLEDFQWGRMDRIFLVDK